MNLAKGSCRALSYIALSLILLVCFLANTAYAAAESFDTPPAEPSRLVMQIIDNQFYKWYEYDSAINNHVLIYQLKPAQKQLTAEETAALLKRSRQWENQPFLNSNNVTIDSELPVQLQGLSDNRIAIDGEDATRYPYYNVGYLTTYFPTEFMRSSGFLVTPYVALTNAHNVYNPIFGGWFDTINFSPGQYENGWPDVVKPYSSLSPKRAETNEKYLEFVNNGDRDDSIKYDYAAIFFNKAFSGISTFVPLEFNYNPERIFLLGYPGVVRNSNSLGMWRSEGAIFNKDDFCLYYVAYTSGGNSGSPVMVYNQQADTYRVIGIHSFAFAGDDHFGGGPHFNSKNKAIIEKWLQWTPENTVQVPTDDNPVETLPNEDNDQETAEIPEETQTEPYDTTILNLGDINGDGIINVLDAAIALQHILLLTELDPEAQARTDVNRDNQVNIIDVNLIMQFSLGIIRTF